MTPDLPCPSPEILRRSLDPDDPMPEPERRRIEAHVDHCAKSCKEVIDSLLRGNTLAAGPDSTRRVEAPGAPAPERPPPTVPGYEVLGELGRGGMGVVYQARHVGLNRLVALKMILAGAHAGADDLARFRTEAEAVAALRHANVVQIYEIGEQEGRPYFSLEFMDGGTLAQKLGGAPQPPRQAAELVETLARAVHFAHQQGVIHRDLKPANVLLAADGAPKIADFGLAKRLAAGAGQTRTGEIVGTPGYMAPEQAAPGSAPVGTPADVYALGAILYEMLTGRPPFQAKTAVETLLQVLHDEPVPPRRLQPKTPADLETICLKCLQKEPRRRYGSAEALAEDLGRFLTNRPIQARRVGVMERAVKWVRRNRVVAASAAVVILATAGAVGGWGWAAQDRVARRAESDRRDAARRTAAERQADVALGKAQEAEDLAAAVEEAADDKGAEEPEAPETAKQVLDLLRQGAAALDEAERALADVPGTEAAHVRAAERRRALGPGLGRAEKVVELLNGLDRARAAQAATKANRLDMDSSAQLYATALSAYGLDASNPEGEAAAQIRQARPGLRLALILALDDWGSCAAGRNLVEGQRLTRIAYDADDDDWRRRCRAAAADVGALKALAEAAPDHLPAVSQVLLARTLYARGASSEAAALLRTARRRHPTDFWVYLDLALGLNDLNHPDPATLNEAESCACMAVGLRPGSSMAYQSLGNVLFHQGDWTGAAEAYQKAIERDPTFGFAHSNFGNVLFRQGNLTGAAEAYRKAVELGPTDAVAHYGLGDVLFAQGDRAGAEEHFRKAGELNSKDPTAPLGLGDVLLGRGDRAAAAACFKKAIELDPKNADAHFGLGVALEEQNDLKSAAASYKEAIHLDPKKTAAHLRLGNVLSIQGDQTGAAASYHTALEQDPKLPAAQYGLGNLLYNQGKLDAAAACYRKTLELDPAIAAAHLNLGSVLLAQGDLEGAAACFREAMKLDPNYALAHYNLGAVLDEQGDLEGAVACYTKAIKLDPKYPKSHRDLGLVLLDQGKFAEARASFRRCLDLLAPNDPLRASASDNLRQCDRLLALEAKLPSMLKGERQPADDDERLDLAEICRSQRRYAAAARFSRDAFARHASLADDLQSGDRYAAAGCAARAGCGLGEDAKDLDDKDRAGWRQQALTWLRADLVLRAKQLDGAKPEERKAVGEALRSWQKDAALAGVRDAAELAKLPADEQEAWGKLWRDVQSLVDKAGEKK